MKFFALENIGNAPVPGRIDVTFRDSADYGNPSVKISSEWYIWKPNEEQKYVGKLPEKFYSSEIGIVVAPPDIANRILTGSYGIVYPHFS